MKSYWMEPAFSGFCSYLSKNLSQDFLQSREAEALPWDVLATVKGKGSLPEDFLTSKLMAIISSSRT